MSKYKARKSLQVGDDVYAPGDIITDADKIEVIGSWVYWGDVEIVEEPKKKAVAKKTAAKKVAKK